AVVYTVRNPQRVIGLVLSNTFARGPEWYELVPVMRAFKELTPLAEDEWEFYTLSMASAIVGYSDVRAARQLAEGFRTGMTPSASATPASARGRASSMQRCAWLSASTPARRSRASCWATGFLPSSPPPARRSRLPSRAPAQAMLLDCPYTSASTPATSSAKTT